MAGPRLCVALDARDPAEIMRLGDVTEPYADVFKVGLTSFLGIGGDGVRALAERREVFLDLKFHDVPAQVRGAVAAAAETGASFTTVHASGGRAMLRAAVEGAAGGVDVLAVTVLTSLDTGDLAALGRPGAISEQVARLTEVALGEGVDGVVCSGVEVAGLRRRFGPDPLVVVPAVRAAGAPRDDQRRTMTAGDAAAAGADVLVVGRPITGAPDPAAAARALRAEVGE